jgi:hypothetical protein
MDIRCGGLFLAAGPCDGGEFHEFESAEDRSRAFLDWETAN